MEKRKDIAILGLFLGFAIIAGYIERLIPSPIPMVPGIKLGVANTVVIIMLYIKDTRTAFMLNVLRIIAAGVLFSGPWGMVYSFAGAVLSFCVMVLLKKTNIFSIIGISTAGGVFHNIGQICAAALAVGNIKLFYYMPILILSGVATGILIGFISGSCIMRIRIPRF